MVQEHRCEYPSLWAAIEPLSAKIGCVPQTLNEWVKKCEIDSVAREGVTSDECERIKARERLTSYKTSKTLRKVYKAQIFPIFDNRRWYA